MRVNLMSRSPPPMIPRFCRFEGDEGSAHGRMTPKPRIERRHKASAEANRRIEDSSADGRGGVDAYRDGEFDIVLMDLQMPEMDGITASRLIREWEHRQGLPRRPIVIISADSRAETQEAAQDAGADGYITKPMSKADLFSALYTHFPADTTAPGTPAQQDTPLSPLLPRYFEQMEQDIEAMRRAVDAEEIEPLQALAHAAKGHSQMFGFADLAKTAGDLEDLAETSSSMTPDLRSAWEKLRALYAETTALRRTTG